MDLRAAISQMIPSLIFCFPSYAYTTATKLALYLRSTGIMNCWLTLNWSKTEVTAVSHGQQSEEFPDTPAISFWLKVHTHPRFVQSLRHFRLVTDPKLSHNGI